VRSNAAYILALLTEREITERGRLAQVNAQSEGTLKSEQATADVARVVEGKHQSNRHVQIDAVTTKLAALLDDTTSSGKLSFCHIAYALGRMKSETAIPHLAWHISNEDPWARVDAVGALAHYPFESVSHLLAEALLSENDLKDYMSVVVSKHHLPEKFLAGNAGPAEAGACNAPLREAHTAPGAVAGSAPDSPGSAPDSPGSAPDSPGSAGILPASDLRSAPDSPGSAGILPASNLRSAPDSPGSAGILPASDLRSAGAALVLGLIDAAEHTFSSEIIWETKAHESLDLLINLATATREPIAVAAALSLIDWLCQNFSEKSDNAIQYSLEQLKQLKEGLTNKEIQDSILSYIEQNLSEQTPLSRPSLVQLRHSVYLAGHLQIEAAEPLLVAHLSRDSVLVDEIIAALGAIGKATSLPTLIRLANQVVDCDERNSRAKSKQPVVEEEAKNATTYWNILKALAKFPQRQAAEFLLAATQDFAPDKRAQAVTSLAEVLAHEAMAKAGEIAPTSIDKVISAALNDPSSLVQLASLAATVKLHRGAVIPQIVPLLDAQENAVSKHSLNALFALADNGYKMEVIQLLKTRSKHERQPHKKKQIDAFLARASG
jgi:hypothetical protein